VEVIKMKLMHSALTAGFAAVAITLAACSSQHGGTAGTGSNSGGDISSLNGNVAQGDIGSVGMHLTIGNGVSVTSLNWVISNGTNTYTGTIAIGSAGAVEFVAGGIAAGSGYVVTLTGTDTSGDFCSGTSAPITVTSGATSNAVVLVTCTIPTDAAIAADVTTGSVGVDAAVTLVPQAPFQCPGITSFSISPASVLPPQTAALTSLSTAGGGGTETMLWTTSCSGAVITNPTSPGATFACGSATGACTVTLTVNLNGTGPDGGNVGPVCTGVAFTTLSDTIVCESGGTLACFAPTPNVCAAADGGPAYCANLLTDASNCGTCGKACPAALPACVAGVCKAPLPTVCTTAGQANCVSCSGSTGGLCTPTEAPFVQLDINSGAATVAGPDPAGSCYACLLGGSCLDSPTHHVSGVECGDLTGNFTNGGGTSVPAAATCLATLGCVTGVGAPCALNSNGLSFCYCGTGGGAPTVCASHGTAANGACFATEAAGFAFTSTDANDILLNFTDTTEPSGQANNIAACALSNGCNQCL
jgi:hypothetical protein